MAGSTRVLVVDDERVVCTLIYDVLSQEGYAVETSADPRIALDWLRQRDDFSVLLTDIVMPEMDGIRLICEARALRPELIPVVMTGFATIETARAAVKEGAYDYILKPFSLCEVKLAVAKALERRRLLEENARLRELTGLISFSESISHYREEGALLEFVLKAALERVGADRGSIMVTVPDGRALAVAANVGLPEEVEHSIVAFGHGISGLVAEDVRSLLVKDLDEHPDLANRSLRLREKSFVSLPLERRRGGESGLPGHGRPSGRVLAVLNVTRKRNGLPFNETDLKALNIIANQAATALENVRLIHDVESAHLATLQSMALLLEARDAYTHGHSQRVRHWCVLGAQKLGMTDEDIQRIQLGAALHDLGKIGLSDAVLNKAGPLSPEEWEMVRRHPVAGYDVLAPVSLLTPGHLELVRSHHERLDGRGYPDGLRGDQLTPQVRLIAVADAYDAMASDRAYRPAMAPEQIVGEIERCKGTQFDPEVADLFIRLIETGEIHQPGQAMLHQPIALRVG